MSKTESICQSGSTKTLLYASSSRKKTFENFGILFEADLIKLYAPSHFSIESLRNQKYEPNQFCLDLKENILVAEVCKETKHYLE